MRTGASLAALLALASAIAAWAADPYPNRPIRLIVPYSVGGATDITSRIVAPHLGDSMGQQVVVDNRAGGASITGTDMVAKAAPDGYTILMASIAFGANAGLYVKLPYDPQKDFAPVSLVAIVPMVLAVHPSVPVRSVKELLALAKAKPGTLNYGSAGNGSANHLATELLKYMTATKIVHVPYKGGGPAVVAIVAGETSMLFATISSSLQHYKSGRLIPLAVSPSKRNTALPDVPTVAEAGVPGYDFFEWQGVVVPAGTPQAVIDRLHKETVKALTSPDARERIVGLGLDVAGSTPQQFAAHLNAEVDRWKKVAKQ
ncbi:MAG: tripartite tricarboxylate transporter substrate binding protein, partial [Pseudomonadota bacterium]